MILPGNSVNISEMKLNETYHLFPTLLEGDKYFQEKSIVNNLQTRVGIENQGHKVIFFYNTCRNTLVDLFKTAIAVRQIVIKSKTQITHIYWGGISGLFILLFCPGNTVLSLLGSDLYGTQYNDKRRFLGFSFLQSFSSKISALIASRTIVMSKKMQKELWNKNSKEIFAIPEGISLNKFFPGDKSLARTFLNWKADSFIAIFFDDGQLVKNKELALESFEKFKLECPISEIKLISGYKHKDLIQVYRGADVMILTSFHEGSNNSLKEAMACNLPIISVDCGDSCERLNGVYNCHICNYDSTEIAEKLSMIYENGERSNGSIFVENFTIESVANCLSNVYNGIVRV